jgi:hypothetical protein
MAVYKLAKKLRKAYTNFKIKYEGIKWKIYYLVLV